jgi:hypothetical protein
MCTVLYALLFTGDQTFLDALLEAPSVYLDSSLIFDFYTNAGRSFGSNNPRALLELYNSRTFFSVAQISNSANNPSGFSPLFTKTNQDIDYLIRNSHEYTSWYSDINTDVRLQHSRTVKITQAVTWLSCIGLQLVTHRHLSGLT